MQLDDQERSPIFYVVLAVLLICSIIFFANSVKKAINSKNSQAQTTQTIEQEASSQS